MARGWDAAAFGRLVAAALAALALSAAACTLQEPGNEGSEPQEAATAHEVEPAKPARRQELIARWEQYRQDDGVLDIARDRTGRVH